MPFYCLLQAFARPGNALSRYVLVLYLHLYFICHYDNNSIWLIVVWGGVHYTLQYVHVSYYERLLIGMLSKKSLVVIFLSMLIAQIIYHRIHLIRNELLGMLYYLTSSLESKIIQIKRWYSKILEIDCTM